MNYYLHLVFMIEIYIILVISLNMQLGFSGLMNFAMGIFMGLGAYSYALISLHFGIPFIPTLLLVVVINMALSLFISLASMRFKDEIFLLVSIAFQIIVYSILWNWTSLTGGANGISNIPTPTFFGYTIDTNIGFVILSTVLLGIILFLFEFIKKSAFGRTLLAIKDNEMSALSIGKNAVKFKVINVAIACGIASVSGILFASFIGYIDTTSFSIHESIDVIFILVLGGILSTRGAVVGTIIFFVLQELFKSVGFGDSVSFNIRIILFSIIILFLMFYKPKGLFGKYKIS